jgi:hypothetical protein
MIRTLILIAGLTLLSGQAGAAGLRCDTVLVSRGMTPLEVAERCGPPEYQAAFFDYRYPGVLVHVDEWLYHLGSNRFRRLLTFENGRLVRIEIRSKPHTVQQWDAPGQPTAARALRNSLNQGPSSFQDESRHGF